MPGRGGSCSTTIATFFICRRKRDGMTRSAFSTKSSNSATGSTHHHRNAKKLRPSCTGNRVTVTALSFQRDDGYRVTNNELRSDCALEGEPGPVQRWKKKSAQKSASRRRIGFRGSVR